VKRPAGSRWSWAFLIDITVFLFVCAAVFGVYAIGRSWLGPVHLHVEISQNPRVLPLYALYSLVRISVAYALSLVLLSPTPTSPPAPGAPKSSWFPC